MPPLADFEDLLDDEERTLQKKYFQNQNKDHIWNFKAELKKKTITRQKFWQKLACCF